MSLMIVNDKIKTINLRQREISSFLSRRKISRSQLSAPYLHLSPLSPYTSFLASGNISVPGSYLR